MAAYIQPADYAAFGIPNATAAQVAQASRNIDNYLGRPEGLLWSPDANGQPAWMTGLTPTRSFPLPQTIQPGSGIEVAIPYAQFGYQNIGDVVILDRANNNLAEACVVSAADGNTLTLENVQFAHAAQATMDFGLTILHEGVASGPLRRAIRIGRAPLVQVLCGFGRYAYDPKGSQLTRGGAPAFLSAEFALLGTLADWTEFSLSDCDIDYDTGVITLEPGLPQSGFNRVRLRYVAGWQYATLPDAIKQATANLVLNAMGTAELPGNVRMIKAGDATIEKFSDSVLDADTRALLMPYRTIRI